MTDILFVKNVPITIVQHGQETRYLFHSCQIIQIFNLELLDFNLTHSQLLMCSNNCALCISVYTGRCCCVCLWKLNTSLHPSAERCVVFYTSQRDISHFCTLQILSTFLFAGWLSKV